MPIFTSTVRTLTCDRCGLSTPGTNREGWTADTWSNRAYCPPCVPHAEAHEVERRAWNEEWEAADARADQAHDDIMEEWEKNNPEPVISKPDVVE